MENAAQMASELSFTSVILRLALATLIGTLVGTERSSRGRNAGVKTHALVCMGAALVMLTSEYMRVSLRAYEVSNNTLWLIPHQILTL